MFQNVSGNAPGGSKKQSPRGKGKEDGSRTICPKLGVKKGSRLEEKNY